MSALIKHQIIKNNGQPLFVVVPYSEYIASLSQEADVSAVIPLAVSKAAHFEGRSLIRAWREHQGLSQADMAERMEISRPAYSQMEARGTSIRAATLHRLAIALGVTWEQIYENDVTSY